MRILVFGNPHLPDDVLAVKVAKNIQVDTISFQISSDVNDLLEENYDAILDVAYGVPKVILLDDLDKLQEHKLISLHDYDVSFFLKLMKAMGKIKEVKIIAIPIGYDEEKAVIEVKNLLKTLDTQ